MTSRDFIKIFSRLIILAGLAACGESPQNVAFVTSPAQDWFVKIKEKIIADYNLGTDSTTTSPIEDGQFVEIKKFRRGELKLKLIQSNDGRPMYETLFADGGNFELRRQYCGNGQMAFEGINYKGEYCGLSTWWHCNGKPEHQGWRWRSKSFGKWTFWKEDGSLDREENFGLMEYLDSLNRIDFSL